MNRRKYAMDALMVFAIAFIVGIIVTFLYSLIAHGTGVIDWQTAVTLAVIMAIVIPWVNRRRIV